MAAIPESELIEFLKAIEDGTITLQAEQTPQDIYAGNVPYLASNGWHVTVFNDCNEWDYLDRVKTADGRQVDFDTIDNEMPIVRMYDPGDEVAWRRYGIPGYCAFRCVACDVELADHCLRCLPFLCAQCSASRSG